MKILIQTVNIMIAFVFVSVTNETKGVNYGLVGVDARIILVAMKRTTELDKHWLGFYWCESCKFYTGQLDLHINHDLWFLTDCPLFLKACELEKKKRCG